jgi:hypothetical protein
MLKYVYEGHKMKFSEYIKDTVDLMNLTSLNEKEIIKKFKNIFRYSHNVIKKQIKELYKINNDLIKLKIINENYSVYEKESTLLRLIIKYVNNMENLLNDFEYEKNNINKNKSLYKKTKTFKEIKQYINERKLNIDELEQIKKDLYINIKKISTNLTNNIIENNTMDNKIVLKINKKFNIKFTKWDIFINYIVNEYHKKEIIPVLVELDNVINAHKDFYKILSNYKAKYKNK